MVPMLQCGFVRWNFSLAMLALHPSTQKRLSSPKTWLASGVLRLHLFGDRLRNLRIVVELHGELRPALAHRAERVHVAEHVGERDHGADHRGIAAGLLPTHLAAPAGQGGVEAADIVLRRHRLDLRGRVKQLGAGFQRAFAEGGAGRDLKRHDARINVVIGAVDEADLDVEDREAREHAGIDDALHPLLHARDVFLRHIAADHLVLELEALSGLVRLDHELDAGELAGAAGLLLVGVVDLGFARHGLAISDLRRADIGLDLELAAHAIDDDVEMQLAHALDDGLARLMVDRDAERRVLLRQAMQRHAELLLIALGLWLDGNLDDRLRELHALEDHGLRRIGQRIASGDVLEAGQRHDVAGISLLDVLAVIGVHQEHTADALLLVLYRVEQGRAGLHLAGIDAAEGKRTHERIVHDLESEHGERLAVGRRARRLFTGLEVDALHRRHIDGRRQIVDDRVEHRLHALVLEGRAAQDRHEHVVDRALADQRLKSLLARMLAFEIGLRGPLVELDRLLNELLVIFLGLIDEIGGDLLVMELGAQGLVVPHHRLHADEVDDALEFVLRAERQLNYDWVGPKPVAHHLYRDEEVGADLVHLVDENHARHAVFVRLPPHRLGLRLNALVCIKQRHRAVEHT